MTVFVVSTILFSCVCFYNASSDSKGTSAPQLSLKETLAKVDKLAVKISEGMEDGETEKAHGPIHDIGHILERVPKMIDASSLGDDDKKTLKQSVDVLIESFGAVDAKMHGKEDGAEFSDVKDKIDEALESIRKISGSLK